MMLTELQAIGNGSVRLKFVVLGEESEYWANAYNLNDLIEYEERIGPVTSIGSDFSVVTLRYLLWLTLRHKQPEITEEEAGKLFTLPDLDKIKDLVMGFLPSPKEAEPEAAAEEASG